MEFYSEIEMTAMKLFCVPVLKVARLRNCTCRLRDVDLTRLSEINKK